MVMWRSSIMTVMLLRRLARLGRTQATIHDPVIDHLLQSVAALCPTQQNSTFISPKLRFRVTYKPEPTWPVGPKYRSAVWPGAREIMQLKRVRFQVIQLLRVRFAVDVFVDVHAANRMKLHPIAKRFIF